MGAQGQSNVGDGLVPEQRLTRNTGRLTENRARAFSCRQNVRPVTARLRSMGSLGSQSFAESIFGA